MTSRAYLVLTLLFYAVGALHVLVHALTRKRLLSSVVVAATLLGFAVHTAGLSQRWTEAGYFPAVGLHDATSFLAWVTVLVFLLVYLGTRVDALGLATYPGAFLLMLVANFSSPTERSDAGLQSLFLPLHATLAFLGYASLFVACAMGVLYLVQERELRRRRPLRLYYLVPSLERSDQLGGRSAEFGFVFLTFAILTGLLWNYSVSGRYWSWDAKEVTAVLAWFIYVLLLVARRRAGWGGRRAALLSIAGFSAVVIVFLFTSITPGVSVAGR
jgi:cytochrome c-type biogenesis protein CcsB